MEKKRILLVDDSELVSGMLTQYLEENGFDVLQANNGVEAIEIVYKEIPDVIIMDVEMPLLQGYQASRLLKSRRGVKEIPIIMHTGLTEDKDQYWALASGANAFVNKDFDNLAKILSKVKELVDHGGFNEKQIRSDGASVTRDSIFEMIGNIFDKELFKTTILNLLSDVGKSIDSLTVTAFKILKLLNKVCDGHIAVILIKYENEVNAYIYPSEEIFENDVDDFLSVCLNDFYNYFPTLDLDNPKKHFLGISERKDFKKIRMDHRRISSYTFLELKGKGGAVTGTLHIGSLANNYFSDYILDNINTFAGGAGFILENSILFNHVNVIHQRIRNVFSKFVPNEMIDDFVERESEPTRMIGEKRKIVVLFADIRDFTTFSEGSTPEGIVGFLNDFFNQMEIPIKKYGGSINKFIGDALLAVFGAPKSYDDNAMRAVKAAIEMIRCLKNVSTSRINLPENTASIEIGIGIHEGDAIVGQIGSSDQYDYTVIGDNVNLASRLEGLTKYYQQAILVSDTIRDSVADSVKLREIDTVKVKGKNIATTIYSIELDFSLNEEARVNWLKGIQLYKDGNWNTALEYFTKVSSASPGDVMAGLFIDRCKKFIKAPPLKWDGVITLAVK